MRGFIALSGRILLMETIEGTDLLWRRMRINRINEVRIAGQLMSAEWKYIEYRLNEGTSNPEGNEIKSTVNIIVENTESPTSRVPSLPVLTGDTMIIDHRYQDFAPSIERIQYNITGELWLEVNHPVPVAEYSEVLRQGNSPRLIVKTWMIGLFTLFFVVPSMALYCYWGHFGFI